MGGPDSGSGVGSWDGAGPCMSVPHLGKGDLGDRLVVSLEGEE